MGMVATSRRIASAFYVFLGSYGDVTQFAQEQAICRQFVYREAHALRDLTARASEEVHTLRQRVHDLEQQNALLNQRLAQAVVLDDQKQAEFAIVGQARGVGLANCHALLEVLIPGQARSVPTLGRRVQEAEGKAAAL